MSAAITAAVVAGGIAAAASSDASRKSIHAQQDAAKAGQVDIQKLDQQTRDLAKQNAFDSAALEKQLTPEVAALRTGANQQLLSGLNQRDPYLDRIKGMANAQLGVPLNTPLLNAAIAKAKANLALGGNLSQDVQNAATRSAIAKSGAIAGNGGALGLGRDVTARDLGLTSLNLENQRLSDASKLGGQEASLATDNSTNFLNLANLFRGINDSQFSKNLSLAQYAQGIQQPVVGLDPGSYANLSVGNQNGASAALTNRANIQGQQSANYGNIAGQLAGSALLAYGNRTPTSTVPTGDYLGTTSLASGGFVVCWVAREIYGTQDDTWLKFRCWLLTKAPRWFRNLYIKYGEKFAAWLHDHPSVKPPIRKWMDGRINSLNIA